MRIYCQDEVMPSLILTAMEGGDGPVPMWLALCFYGLVILSAVAIMWTLILTLSSVSSFDPKASRRRRH